MVVHFNATYYNAHRQALGEAMLIVSLCLAAFLFGIILRQVMRFQEALAKLANNMAVAQNEPASASIYQNAITPPWLPNVWIFASIGFVGAAGAAWYVSGIASLAATAVAFFVGMLLSGLTSARLQRPAFKTYCRYTMLSLLNREADYRKNNDDMRGNATRQFREMLISLTGPELY